MPSTPREEALAIGADLLAEGRAATGSTPVTVAPVAVVEAPPPPDPKAKGILYQVHAAALGEPAIGTPTQERRAGLYADQAGELLTPEVWLANPQGMFERDATRFGCPTAWNRS